MNMGGDTKYRDRESVYRVFCVDITGANALGVNT